MKCSILRLIIGSKQYYLFFAFSVPWSFLFFSPLVFLFIRSSGFGLLDQLGINREIEIYIRPQMSENQTKNETVQTLKHLNSGIPDFGCPEFRSLLYFEVILPKGAF